MDKTVVRLNIEHYRKLLAAETDEKKREILDRLRAEEEAKLTALMDPPEDKTSKHDPEKACPRTRSGGGNRFSEKIILHQNVRATIDSI